MRDKAWTRGFSMILTASLLVMSQCGCFTVVKARTKEEVKPDGVVVRESEVKAMGTGDKASQVAAEGLFADGSAEDLGAGVKNAQASQTSTGIDGTLKGAGDLLNGMANLMSVMQAGQNLAPPVNPQPSPEVNGDYNNANPPTVKSAPKSLVSGEGVPEVAILGNRSSCSRCRTLWNSLDLEALSESACGANVIDADATDNADAYAKYKPKKGGFSYPYVRIFVDGKPVGEFEARGLTAAGIGAKSNQILDECTAPPDK